MTTVCLAELRALIQRHAGPDTRPLRRLAGLILATESGPTLPCRLVIEPVFSLIAQGLWPAVGRWRLRRRFAKVVPASRQRLSAGSSLESPKSLAHQTGYKIRAVLIHSRLSAFPNTFIRLVLASK